MRLRWRRCQRGLMRLSWVKTGLSDSYNNNSNHSGVPVLQYSTTTTAVYQCCSILRQQQRCTSAVAVAELSVIWLAFAPVSAPHTRSGTWSLSWNKQICHENPENVAKLEREKHSSPSRNVMCPTGWWHCPREPWTCHCLQLKNSHFISF